MGEIGSDFVKSESQYNRPSIENINMSSLAPPGFPVWPVAVKSEDNGRSNVFSSNTFDERQQQFENPSASPMCPAPLCRQFWKAGDYNDMFASNSHTQKSTSYMHVHPKFLHSNATSHKWAFGAIAELLDNAIDEIENGSSFVSLDKVTNPRDGSPSLLIQDDGSGMDPEAIRRCMSFGFSDKQSKSAIGKYGNGFKTSTMRLGADVIVFSRHMGKRTLTQSIGFLSYTYLSRTGLDRIVVPMVDYEYNTSTGTFEPLCRNGGENFQSNLSIILGWSPYTTLVELLKQFDDIGPHGTKVIVFNLWFTNDGKLEFDFESEPQDIRLPGSKTTPRNSKSELHIGNQYRYSLRVYMSILYLRIPPTFRMILRGVIVDHHCIARDLKYPEVVMYVPKSGGIKEGEVITTVGFLKEAPDVYIHGFNVYHKNRLILPFWQVLAPHTQTSKGRGVVGVLEANFIEPTHNKQEFERTSVLQKLETRLKDMAAEYWDQHCGLIGYHVIKKAQAPVSTLSSSHVNQNYAAREPISESTSSLGFRSAHQAVPPIGLSTGTANQDAQTSIQEHGGKRTFDDFLSGLGRGRRQIKAGLNATTDAGQSRDVPSFTRGAMVPSQREAVTLKQQNKELRTKCSQYESIEQELGNRVSRLMKELEEARYEYVKMLGELQAMDLVDADKKVFERSQARF